MCGGRGEEGRRRPEAAGAAERVAGDNADNSAGGRARRCRLPRAAPLAVLVVCVAWGSPRAAAQRGYDKEETPTGIWKGYCLPRSFKQTIGLCAGYEGNPNVCSASISGENTKSGQYWLDMETFNIRAPHTDKALIKGTQSFETLQLYINNWACKQMGENVRQRNTLTDDEKQTAACNFVWRRDQEIQNEANFSVPAAGYPWGTFLYKPPGQNLTTFMFKGAPKQQCQNDYECREVNTPGEVYTSCDFCEDYFNTYCDVNAFDVFKFCMEKVHCVCNSVLAQCATPSKKRCPQKGDEPDCHPAFPDGMYFPLYGAPASPAAPIAISMALPLLGSLIALVSSP